MEKEPAGRGGRVNLIGQGFEMYTALFQVTHYVNQISHTAPQLVELPHDQGIVFPQDIQSVVKAFP